MESNLKRRSFNGRAFLRGLIIVVVIVLRCGSAYSQFVQYPVPGLPGLAEGSVAWGDFDGDGRMDFVLSGSLHLSLWRNTGNGFSNVTAQVAPGLNGMFDNAVAWGDFDNDGRLDLLISGLTNASMQGISQLWRNTGNGFTNVHIAGLPGLGQSAVAWCDFDRDGRLDFLITGTTNGTGTGALTQLWRNTGTGFTKVPVPGLPGFWQGSVVWGDFDNDGWPDFLITGLTNGATGGAASQLWRNTGNGFTNVPIPGLRGVFVGSVAWGDYDNDGWLDFVMEGLSGNTFVSELWRNTGNGFTNVPIAGLPGIADGSLAWGDFDNDGRLDFLITGLTNGVSKVSQIWRYTGNEFTNVPVPDLLGNFDNALAVADFDNDNRLDFLIAGSSEDRNVSELWRNTAEQTNARPAAPTGLSSTVAGNTVRLAWNAPPDDHTPAAGLSYNLRLGTTPGGSEIFSVPALKNGRLTLPQMGTIRGTQTFLHQLLPAKTYYWTVQAVDTSFAGSAFAAEAQFTTGTNSLPIVINPRVDPSGVFHFDFVGQPGGQHTVMGGSETSLSLTNWTATGSVTEISPGRYQFTDSDAPNHSGRFYRVR